MNLTPEVKHDLERIFVMANVTNGRGTQDYIHLVTKHSELLQQLQENKIPQEQIREWNDFVVELRKKYQVGEFSEEYQKADAYHLNDMVETRQKQITGLKAQLRRKLFRIALFVAAACGIAFVNMDLEGWRSLCLSFSAGALYWLADL